MRPGNAAPRPVGEGSLQPRMIVIEPSGGLGNRMRAIDSAVGLAESRGRPLRVIWLVSPELNCRFGDLFERRAPVADVREIDFSKPSGILAYRLLLPVLRRWRRHYSDRDHHGLKTKGPDFREVGRRVLHYRICHPFFPNPRPFAAFVPLAPLREQVEAYRRERQVGVHIRRADNANAISRSPTRRFIELMEAEAAAEPRTSFFLATDAPEEERVLRERFPGRVHAHPKRSLDRRTPEAARDALVDLYALSDCDKIIGSHYSSFTDVAAGIRGIPKILALE